MSYFSEMSYKTDMTRAVAYPNSAPPLPPPPHTLSGPCITTKNRTILNMSDINHMRRKLFNIVGGIPREANINTLGGGGGVYCKMYIHACMHTHMYERMYKLLNVQTPMHACTHTCMHACICTHTIIHLNLDMKSIKIKANGFYGKNKQIYTCNFTSSERSDEESFWLLYYLKSI